jgi:hypothetical protein
MAMIIARKTRKPGRKHCHGLGSVSARIRLIFFLQLRLKRYLPFIRPARRPINTAVKVQID